jgi:hypothetical protein
MLKWFRARVPAVAGALLVSLAALGGLSTAAHGADCHDEDCGIIAVRHDPSTHAIDTAGTASDHPLHCILCHWTRSLRPSTESVDHIARPLAGEPRRYHDVSGTPSQIQAAQPPLRSPPAAAAPIA